MWVHNNDCQMKNKLALFFVVTVMSSCNLRTDKSVIENISEDFEKNIEFYDSIHDYFMKIENGELLSVEIKGDYVNIIKNFETIKDFEKISCHRDSLSNRNSLLNEASKLKSIVDFMCKNDIGRITYSLEEDRLNLSFDKIFFPCASVIYDGVRGIGNETYSKEQKYWKYYLEGKWYIQKVSCAM